MAFGISRNELVEWKKKVQKGELAFLTHYWVDERFPNAKTVTKVGCKDVATLIKWGEKYHLKPQWIHHDEKYPHFDLIGENAYHILKEENQLNQYLRFYKTKD